MRGCAAMRMYVRRLVHVDLRRRMVLAPSAHCDMPSQSNGRSRYILLGMEIGVVDIDNVEEFRRCELLDVVHVPWEKVVERGERIREEVLLFVRSVRECLVRDC